MSEEISRARAKLSPNSLRPSTARYLMALIRRRRQIGKNSSPPSHRGASLLYPCVESHGSVGRSGHLVAFCTGEWIVSHGNVPMTDPFSGYGMGKPWVAYSWLFEILVYGLFTKLGLMGILVFTVSMSLLIALVLHGALRWAGLPFITEMFRVAIALGAMSSLFTPRPWLFSILFFTVELFILFHLSERTRLPRYWRFHRYSFYGRICTYSLFTVSLCLDCFSWRFFCRSCHPLACPRTIAPRSPLGEYHFYYLRVWLQL